MAFLQERVIKSLHVCSYWFLFSDAYVNGLRATFLRYRNSGVPPFHSICVDSPPLKDLNSFEANLTDITDGSGPNQDFSLAIGEGVVA